MNLQINGSLGVGYQPFPMSGMQPGGMGPFPGNPQQQMMMAAFGMMAMTMMSMMQQMMGQNGQGFPMPMGPGQFGVPGCGCGPMGGSPVGNFLGGGSPMGGPFPPFGGGMPGFGGGMPGFGGGMPGGYGMPGGGGAAQGPGGMPPSPMGPAGNVGNVNVERLVSALPRGHQNAARQHFPHIVAEAQRQGIQNKAQLAYILATTVHESGAGAHMEEFASGRAYEGRRDLGNSQAGDGVRYKGRGYVQITGRRNYTDWSRRLGVDLVGNPNMAKDPRIAARILVGGMKDGTFTGRGLDQYINNNQTDFHNARRIVNGTDKAGTFAQTAQRLLAAMN